MFFTGLVLILIVNSHIVESQKILFTDNNNYDENLSQSQVPNNCHGNSSVTSGGNNGNVAKDDKAFVSASDTRYQHVAMQQPIADPSIGGMPVPLANENNRIKVNGIFDENSILPASEGSKPVPTDYVKDTNNDRSNKYSTGGVSNRFGSPYLKYTKPEKDVEPFFWQASVYSKHVEPFVRVCGGSIVTTVAVISAARCFWDQEALPASRFEVVAGVDEGHQQNRDVDAIKIPPRYRGELTNYQDDIAVLLLKLPLYLDRGTKPVCVSFDPVFEEADLEEGNMGYILNIEPQIENESLTLRNKEVVNIDVVQCMRDLPPENLKYMTSDKICTDAVYKERPPNDICVHDLGSGLFFGAGRGPSLVPFLRGVLSMQAVLGFCLDQRVTTYTRLWVHRSFLLQHIPGLAETCGEHYPQLKALRKEDQREGDSDSGEDIEFLCNCYC